MPILLGSSVRFTWSCAAWAVFLSQVDMMLAALARQHKLTVLTTDRDFEALTDLRVEKWAL
jgi:predicted nucleic acid-binding protein